MNYFISDTHFGHHNIIGACDRPFKDVMDMDETMIQNWNNTVHDSHHVWHGGDFTFHRDKERIRYIFNALKGRKHLIWGNHDSDFVKHGLPWESSEQIHRFDFQHHPVDSHRLAHPKTMIMFHYPIIEWDKAYHGAYHIHGHTHVKSPLANGCGFRRWRNISAEQIGYTPIGLDKLFDWDDPNIRVIE